MAEDRLKVWETLFKRALELIDSVAKSGTRFEPWSFGGGIDFVASAPLTANPTIVERIFDRDVRVETSTEIIAKKVWHRAAQFKARDMFDLALVAEKEPDALKEIRPVLRDRRDVILGRIKEGDEQLRNDFAELEVLDYRPSYNACLKIIRHVLETS